MARYKIFEELGAGGAGQVFKGHDGNLDRYVAMKRLLTREESESGGALASELLNEAASLAKLRHPNIVSVFGVEKQDQGTFIVMELLEGGDLEEWLIREGPLSMDDFGQFAVQTLEALLAAHQQNILHRDLKPGNIKVTRLPGGRFQAKIIDFGLARLSPAARKQTQDQSGNVLGSVNYMAPEQLRRLPLDFRMDLYALGCVFFEALSGTKAFSGRNVQEIMDNHLRHNVVSINELVPELDGPLASWVMWLISADPAERPESAATALDALHDIIVDSSKVRVAARAAGVILPGVVSLAPSDFHTGQAEYAESEAMESTNLPPQPSRGVPWVAILIGGVVAAAAAMLWINMDGGEKLTGSVIGTAGTFKNNGNDLSKAFDGNTDTYFDAPTAGGAWVGLDLGANGSSRITAIRFYPRSDNPLRMLGGKFQASNTAEFTREVQDLYEIKTEPPVGWTKVKVDSHQPVRYVRYLSPETGWGNVAEIEFLGAKEP